MGSLREKLLGTSGKDLLPGERALQFHLAPQIIVIAGALMVVASMFMPTSSSTQFATITGNMVIQNDPELLLCSIAATVAAVRYWKVGSAASANVAIGDGLWFLLWVLIIAQGLKVTGTSGAPYYLPANPIRADAGAGLWTAGVGSLLVAYGGLMMRFPDLGFGLVGAPVAPLDEQAPSAATKICPKCAEEVKAAATVCRYCHHEFAQAPSV